MANEDDLVSNVRVTGTQESEALLKHYADVGEQSFKRTAAAAKQAAAEQAAASKQAETAAKEASAAIEAAAKQQAAAQATAARAAQLAAKEQVAAAAAAAKLAQANAQAGQSSSIFAANLGQVEQGAARFTAALRSAIPQLASFVARTTAAAAGAVAAGVGLLKVASNVVKGGAQQESQTDKVAAAQQRSAEASAQQVIGAINLESSQRKLFKQLQSGAITYKDYNKALTDLNADYKEQQRVEAQTAAVQENLRQETERLQKQAANTKAFQAQVDMFGGPLLSSLTALGNVANTTFNEFKQAFGPAIASAVDTITQALTTNGASISAFFTDAAAKISAFIAANGPAIQQALTTVGTGIKLVFDGLINALPGLLSFFNGALVPAFKAFGAVLDTIASAVNAVFGTKFTAGAIVILVIVGQLTGGIIALIGVLKLAAAAIAIIIGLPFGAVFIAIAAAIAALLFFFPQFRQIALDTFNGFINILSATVNGAVAAGAGIIAAFTAVGTFFSTLFTGIANIFTGGWALIVAGVAAAVSAVQAAWSGTVAFFQSIGDQLTAFFTTLWTGIVNSFNTAINSIKQFFTDLYNSAKANLGPILTLLEAIAKLSASAVSGGGSANTVNAAGGGHIRGPGTSTSDSIPAWLSNNEFVMKSKAVAKYGVGFMKAINSGQFRMPRFNMGGLVSSMITGGPRIGYADGGEVTSNANMRPLSLTLFGETFDGLLAPEDVGGRLTKFAVGRQNKSAGRKPAWVGRGRN